MRRIHILGILLLIIVFFLLGTYAGSYIKQRENNGEPAPPEEESAPEPEDIPAVPDIRTATMVSAGAIYPHTPQLDQAYIGDGKYDFTPSFEVIKPLVETADLAVVTLETAQAGLETGGYSAYPTFNSPLAVSEALKWAGFDLFNTANNHIMDRGYDGLMLTLDHVRGLGIDVIGTHKSWEERNTPYIRDINGIKVGFISYTYNTNGFLPPERHEYAINYIPEFHTIEPLIEDIKAAREAGADLVTSTCTGGRIRTRTWRAAKEMAEAAKAGADLIIGTHTHVLQPIDLINVTLEDGATRKAVVIYALGNFAPTST